MSALYIHIPFCKKVCNYCDFYKKSIVKDDPHLDRYFEALGREMEFRHDYLADDPVETIFFGGGTPSVYSPEILQAVIDRAREEWNLLGVTEITVEINPDDASDDWLSRLAQTDVNRLSFGVQSFINRHLITLGRRHTAEQAVSAVKTARGKGFDNISIDLMFGLPGMSLRDWEFNITKALRLGVDHISAYHLTIEPETPLARLVKGGKLKLVTEEESEAQFRLAHGVLSSAGFDHYEVSNYALTPLKRARHNCAYWNGEKYLGIGPSAHSYDGRRREFAASSLVDYLENAGTDKIYDGETLTDADRYNEFVMLSLRTSSGLRRDVLTQKFGIDMLLYFEYAAMKFLPDGLLVHGYNEYRIPPEKMMLSDAIIRDLFITETEE